MYFIFYLYFARGTFCLKPYRLIQYCQLLHIKFNQPTFFFKCFCMERDIALDGQTKKNTSVQNQNPLPMKGATK